MNAGALGRRAVSRDAASAQADPSSVEAGSELDLSRVYEAHFRYVWRCLRSLGVRDSQLEDALQDVFVVVQRKLPAFEARAELRTWLYAIALRIARKYKDRARREPTSLEAAREQDPELPHAPDESGDAAIGSERLALARRALSALDDDKREVFVLARVEQMSAPEIAGVLGIPLNTVYSRLRIARLAFDAEVSRLAESTRNSR